MKYFYFLLIIVCGWGCAVPQAPQGGPKDFTPPVLLSASPVNGSTNFKGKSIYLEFDEEVSENNAKQFFLSPITQSTNDIGTKRLKITPDSGFVPNTTYSISLTKKIKDEKEGNYLKDTSFIFSTGATLDTLKTGIRVLDFSNKSNPTKATAILEDGIRRRYFSISDSAKPLEVRGIHSGKYYLEVYNDANENYTYDEEDGKLFFDSVSMDSNQVLIVKPMPQKYKTIKNFKQVRNDTLSIEATSPIRIAGEVNKSIVYTSPKRDVYRVYPFNKRYEIEYFDSLGNCMNDTLDKASIDSLRSFNAAPFTKESSVKVYKKVIGIMYSYDWDIEKKPSVLEVNQDSVWQKVVPVFTRNSLSFSLPKYQAGKVKLRMDTISFYSKTGYTKDSIVVDKGELDPKGDISGTLQAEIQQEIYIELLDAQQKSVAKSKGKNFMFHVKPGKYTLQAFVDWNGDGFYTGGNKVAFRKAEPLYKYETVIELKPGWDIEKLSITPGF